METVETTYTICVETSDAYKDAGTNAYVYVQLVGADGKTKTDWAHLDILFKDNFQVGSTDKFKVQLLDVGLPTILNLKLENWLKDEEEWLCNTVEVFRGKESVLFPIFTYITDHMEVLSGEAVLPQNETNGSRLNIRNNEIERNKSIYPWVPIGMPGLARYVNAETYDQLPRMFKRYTIRQKDIEGNRFKGQMGAALGVIKATVFDKIQEIDDYRIYAKKLEKEPNPVTQNWRLDEATGWDLLNGSSPIDFNACKSMAELPSHFLVKHDDVKHLLRPGKCLEGEMKEGRVFVTDFTECFTPGNGIDYMGIGDGVKAYCPQSMALLYINEAQLFVPIAIQLKPDDRDYLFTSEDSLDWLLAKMYFRSSSLNNHEWLVHFLRTHLSMEPIALALFRCLSNSHPVYKLLRPHLATIAAINAVGRTSLLPPDCKVAEGLAVLALTSVKYHYKTLQYEDLHLPKFMKKKGIDYEKIPSYWYGRDINKLWKLVEEFTSNLLRVFYKTDEDVVNDTELQDFAHEMCWEGFAWEDKNTRGFPEKFTSIDQLVEFATIIAITNSAQHAAVNYGQFEDYSFSPNAPATMNLPPHKKGEATMERIMNTLPNPTQAAKSVAMAYNLSQFSNADEYLGEFRDRWFVEKEVVQCQKCFQKKLIEFGDEIDARNSRLCRKYARLHPRRVPISIGI